MMRRLVLHFALSLFVTIATPWPAHALSFVLQYDDVVSGTHGACEARPRAVIAPSVQLERACAAHVDALERWLRLQRDKARSTP